MPPTFVVALLIIVASTLAVTKAAGFCVECPVPTDLVNYRVYKKQRPYHNHAKTVG